MHVNYCIPGLEHSKLLMNTSYLSGLGIVVVAFNMGSLTPGNRLQLMGFLGCFKQPSTVCLLLCYMCFLSGGERSVIKNFWRSLQPQYDKSHSQKTSVSKTSLNVFECWSQYNAMKSIQCNETTACQPITGSWTVKAPAGHSVWSLCILLPGPAWHKWKEYKNSTLKVIIPLVAGVLKKGFPYKVGLELLEIE